jgi:hypothetical protein
VHRVHPTSNDTNKPYRSNGRFRPLPNVSNRYLSYNQEQGLYCTYDNPIHLSKEYRTHFGLTFQHNGNYRACDNAGLCGSFRRIDSCREPEDPNFHSHLVLNQCSNVWTRKTRRWARLVSKRYCNKLFTDSEELRNNWTDAAHPKKVLRLKARLELINSGRRAHPTWIHEVEYKSKPDEDLPDNKYNRGIGDLSVVGSSRSAYLIDAFKDVMSEPYTFNGRNGITLSFVKTPQIDLVKEALNDTIFGIHNCVYNFSDDLIVGLNCTDRRAYFEVDIKSADSGYYPPLFDLLRVGMTNPRYTDDIDALFKQLHSNVFVRCKVTRQKFKFVNNSMALFSGSSGTTIINNVAITASISMLSSLFRNMTHTSTEAAYMIAQAFRLCGLSVTIKLCNRPEELTFLKMYPCLNINNEYQPIVCLGTWLKGFGRITGDLPGSGDIDKRARAFLGSVVKSRMHWGNTQLSESFKYTFPFIPVRKRLQSQIDRIVDKNLFLRPTGMNDTPLLDSSVIARYPFLDAYLYDELCYHIRHAKLHSTLHLPAIQIILKTDYSFRSDPL